MARNKTPNPVRQAPADQSCSCVHRSAFEIPERDGPMKMKGRRSPSSHSETTPPDLMAQATWQTEHAPTAARRLDAPKPRSHRAQTRTFASATWPAYFGLAAVLYLAIAFFSITKPLTLDQAFPVAYNAAAIADFGYAALGSDAYDYEVAHPPLHQHILALVFGLFGKTTIAARVLNVFCTLLVLFLVIQISREISPPEDGVTIGGIAALLYAINPFVIQHSLIVDQDTTIQPIAVLLFFWVFFRQRHQFNLLAIAKLGAALALCAWTKEFSPILILIPLFLYLWWRFDFLRAFWITSGSAAVGSALFLSTWTIYCWSTGVSLLSFIEFSIVNKALNSDFHTHRSALTGLQVLLARTAPWVTPAFFILLAVAGGYRLRQLPKEGYVARITDLLWLFIAIFWVITTFHMYAISRWQFPLYAAACLVIAEYLFIVARHITLAELLAAVGSGIAVAAVAGSVLDDPLLRESGQSFSHMAAWYAGLWFAAPLFACFLLLTVLRIPALARDRMLLTLISFVIATSFAMNIKQSAAYTTIPSWGSDYGERGFYDALAYLKKHLGDSVPVIRKDFAFYMIMNMNDRDFEWIYTSIFRSNLNSSVEREAVKAAILGPRVEYIVLDRQSRPEQAVAVIEPYFDRVASFGDFRVYRKRKGG